MPNQYSPTTPEERFWNKVDRSGGDDACWLWTAGLTGQGYGSIKWYGQKQRAHRVSYLIAHGTIPDGMNVLHNCPTGDNPLCCNPAHLFLGTQQDNVADRDRKGRRKALRGEANARAKLTDAQVEEMRQRYDAGGITQKELADEYGIGYSHTCQILTRKARVTPWPRQ